MPSIEASTVVNHAQTTLVTEHEIAKLTGMSLFFLRNDRQHKQRIPFFKIGSSVRYSPERVMATLIECGGNTQTKPKAKRQSVNASV